REPPERRPRLAPRLPADDGVEVADHHGVRVRAQRRAEEIVRRPHVRDPVAQRLVDRVLQRAAPRVDGNDTRAEEPHAEDVERLALDVLGAHVHLALEPEERRGRRRRDPMLSRAGLGDHPALLHAPPEAPEAAVTVGERGHRTPFASATNRHTLSGSLRPGSASTPELTSTAYGRAVATARATFSGVRPAERMIRHCWLPSSRATVHSIGWRGSPSLQRAALSSRSAAVHLR